MTLEVYVTATKDQEMETISIGGETELVPTLGGEALAVRIDEIFKSITSLVSSDLSDEADLTIEMTGTTSIKADCGIKYLFFNLGGSASNENLMKVCLKTKIKPKINI